VADEKKEGFPPDEEEDEEEDMPTENKFVSKVSAGGRQGTRASAPGPQTIRQADPRLNKVVFQRLPD